MSQVLQVLLISWLSLLPGYLLAQCVPAASCAPGSSSGNAPDLGFGIFRVQLANVDTLTGGAAEGYQDYSCRRAILLTRGTTYTLHITTGSQADEQVRAWADFNGDGRFDPVAELLLISIGRQHAGSFTVPATLAAGASLRLRIAADGAYAPVPGPCTTPQYSQTEDYRVHITSAPAPAPQARFSAIDSVSCDGLIQLRDDSRNAPTMWRWDLGDGTVSTQQHPVHTYAAAGTYTVRLRVANVSGQDSLTKAAFLVVRADGPRASACQPPTQAYCCDFGLARVRLAGLDHRPGGGAAGYQDASCANRASLRADWADTLRLTTGGTGAHDVRVYLDLNNDGQLDPTAELLYQGLGVKSPAIPLRLSSRAVGLVYNTALRLRIWTDYAGSPAAGPCGAPRWGQVADYAVQVLPNTLRPQASFHLAYAPGCGRATVTVTNTSRGAAAYRWDFGDGTTATTETPPAHTYTAAGVYVVKLVAQGPAGADSTQQETAVAAACPGYCASTAWGGNEESPVYFTRVRLADLDNREPRGPRVGYRDFTRYVATVRQGQAVRLRAESQPFTFSGAGPWVYSLCWIDYNQDGQFGPSELAGSYTGFSPQGGEFVIPHRARLGATRMRLVNNVVGYGRYPSNGCSPDGAPAAIEDYTVLILPEHVAPRGGFVADLAASCSGQVQFRDTTWSAPTSWRWDFGDGMSSTAAEPLHTYAAPGTYDVTLATANAEGGSVVSRAAYVTVTALGQGPRPAVVALSATRLNGPIGLEEATLATLTYPGGADQPGYRDETCAQPALHLQAGGTYPLAVARTSRYAYYLLYLWLDANEDGQFQPGERLFASPDFTSDESPKGGLFTIPVTAPRNRPLRLRLYWHGLRDDDSKTIWPVPDPQTRDEDYDQVRDFTVWVHDAPLATAAPSFLPMWSVYPNPTTGSVLLTGVVAAQGVTLFTALGQVAMHLPATLVPGQGYRIDLAGLPKGLYLLRVPGAAGSQRLLLN